jgi:ubiquitin-protein ligase
LKTENWKPATKISSGTWIVNDRVIWFAHDTSTPTVIQALYDLLQTPNPDDPLVTSIVSTPEKQVLETQKLM